MLIIDVSINRQKLIETIMIHNIGTDEKTGLTQYRIENPKGYEDIIITHKRDDGYRPLLEKAMQYINHQ